MPKYHTGRALSLSVILVAGWFFAAGASTAVASAATLLLAAAPGPPSHVSAVAVEGAATISWVPPTSVGSGPITQYVLTSAPAGRDGANLHVAGTSHTATIASLTDGTRYSFTVTAVNAAGPGQPSLPSNSVVPSHPGGQFHPLAPYRVCDTRPGNPSKLSGPDAQCLGKTLHAGGILTVRVAGTAPSGKSVGGVPASGVTAVVLNVTVTDTTAAGVLTAWPAGAVRPRTSNLNWGGAKQTIANLVQVNLGKAGSIDLYDSAGSTDAIVDVEGYVAPNPVSVSGLYHALPPYRICDTRRGNPSGLSGGDAQCLGRTLGAGATLSVRVLGTVPSGESTGLGVPLSDVAAVAFDVTALDTTAGSDLTAWPTGSPRPTSSNLDWPARATIANTVVVPVGSGGNVNFYNASGSTDLLIDVAGYYSTSTAPGSYFSGVPPARICDTRPGNPSGLSGGAAQCNGKTLANSILTINVAGVGGVPAIASTRTPPVAAVLNVTVTDTSASSALTLWPGGTSRPTAATAVVWQSHETVSSLVVASLGTTGQLSLYNTSGRADVVIDVLGYFSGTDVVPPSTSMLSSSTMALLSSVGPNQSVLNFSKSDSQLSSLMPGDVITAAPAALAPSGLMLTVAGVSPQPGGGLSVETSPANLTEVAPQGSFVVSGAPINSLNPPATLFPRRATRSARVDAPGSCGDSCNTLSLFTTNSACGAGGSGQFNYSGGFTRFQITPTFSASWQWGLPPTVSVSASLRLDETFKATATLGASASISCSESVPIDGINNLVLADPIETGFFGTTITPVLQAKFNLKASGSLSTSETFTATQSAYAEAGIGYSTSSGFSPSGGIGCDPPVPQGTPLCTSMTTSGSPGGVSLTLSAGATLSLVAAIDAIPYCDIASQRCYVLGPVVGPQLSLTGGLQVSFQPRAPIWTLAYNFSLSVGFTANWSLGPINLNLTFSHVLIGSNKATPIAHAIEVDTSGQLPNALVLKPYVSPALEDSGFGTPGRWALGSGAPSWLSINSASGVISGTPPSSVANTNVSVPVQATDGIMHITATQTLSLPVGVPPMSVTTTGLPNATAGKPYRVALQAMGGVPPYAWSLQKGATLPPWLTLSTTGVLSGTVPNTSGDTAVSVPLQVAGKPGGPASATLSFSIGVPSFSWTTPSPPLSVGQLGGISCPSPTLCVAVSPAWTNSSSELPLQTVGEALVYSDGSWTAPAEVDPSAGLNAISCPTTTFCMAVGDSGAAVSYSDGTWSQPATVESPNTYLQAVSCASSAFCVALDNHGYPITYASGTWSAPGTISLASVSCPVSGFCIGVDYSGNAYTYSGGAWSSADDIDGTNKLTGVSCATSSLCIVTDATGQAITYSNGAWSTPMPVDTGTTCWSTTNSAGRTCLGAISCSSASFCMATGPGEGGPSTTFQYPSFVFNGTGWSAGPTLSETYLTGSGAYGYPVFDMSCAAAGFCAAALGNSEMSIYSSGQWSSEPVWLQYFGDVGVSCAPSSTDCTVLDTSGYAATFDSGAWGQPAPAETGSSPVSVSCPTTSFCMAVDINGRVLSESNGVWSAPREVDAAGQPSAIACPSPNFCMISDYSGYVVRDLNGVWSAPQEIDSSAKNQQIDSLSCVSSNFCMAVDDSGNAFTYSNGAWSGPTNVDGTEGLSDVSCPSSTFCGAVNYKGAAFFYSSGTWKASSGVGADQNWYSAPAISCPSSNICVATGNFGDGEDAATYYYGAWSAPSVVAYVEQNTNGWPKMLSCPTVTYCVALGGMNNDVASVGTLP